MLQEVLLVGLEHAAGSQLEIVRAVRDTIDRVMITANVWDAAREDPHDETLQFRLADLIGAFNHAGGFTSPVGYIRELQEDGYFSDEEWLHAAAQIGVGHCGEHAAMAFYVLKGLMSANPRIGQTLGTIILSGQANVDHSFVVGGFRPRRVVQTTVQWAGNKAFELNEHVVLLNLAEQLPGNTEGFVCDPYLAPTAISPTAQGLAQHLQRLRNHQTRTEFVTFNGIYPPQPAPQMDTEPHVPHI